MPSVEYESTPSEVRSFALVQIGLTAGFFVLLFFMLGGTSEPFPPVWLSVVLVVLVGVGAFLAERVWLSASPLEPATAPDDAQREAVGIFAGQTVRKLVYCEAPLLVAVGVAFVSDHGGWPLVVAGFPGLLVLAWEVWPSPRNTSLTAAMLDSRGAESQLVESFLDA
jgi:hypothetical protein